MAKKQREEESGGSWMDTYGDMVTLLLTFFVMLYSMSSITDEKWQEIVSAFNIVGEEKVDAIIFEKADGDEGTAGDMLGTYEDDEENKGTMYNSAIEELFDKIKTYVDENDMSNSILMQMSSDATEEDSEDNEESEEYNEENISIQFNDNVLFEPDQATIKPGSEEVLQFLGDCLASVQNDIAVVIVKGHTAISPTSTVDSRLLSSERAGTISNFFQYNSGMPSTMLIPMGLGSDYPIASNDTEEGRAKNRRVEIVIINKESQLGKSSEFLKAIGASFDINSTESMSNSIR